MALGSSRRDFIRTIAVSVAGTALVRVAGAATLVGMPRVQNVRRSRATIRWATRTRGSGTLEYTGEDGQTGKVTSQVREFLPSETRQRLPWYQHEVLLQKLTAGTQYNYRLALDGELLTDQPLRFKTSGVAPFSFVAFGDSGTGSPEQRTISQLMYALGPDFSLHTGDLVYPTGTYERYESLYFEYYRDLMKQAPMFPCPGNHDYYETSCIPYRALHSVPEDTVPDPDLGRYYSFDWGNAHFVSLDTNDALADAAAGHGRMLEWLDRDLTGTTKFWRIVVLHHPAYSAGIHSDEPESHLIRRLISPILDKHSVPLVLNGHEHSYQRSRAIVAGEIASQNGTVYVTTGGGGAPLHPVGHSDLLQTAISAHHFVSCDVNNGRLQLKATGLGGEILDRFTLAPPPILSERSVVNAADYTARLAPGSLISIFGLQLAPEDTATIKLPLPKVLGGTSVLLNGVAIPVLMVSARQVNVQIPYNVLGPCEIVVRNANGSAKVSAEIVPTAPALFAKAAFHQDDSVVSSEYPADAGEVLTLYATGLGKLAGAAQAGTSSEAMAPEAPVRIVVGSNAPQPVTANAIKGIPGLYAVRFRFPGGGHEGTAAVWLIAGDATGNIIDLPCRN